MEEELFEEKNNQLISLIKTSSRESTIYIFRIAPNGDTDVSSINTCSERLSLYWQKHNVICITNTRDYFYRSNGIPTERYLSSDGIHLSRSGVKRLLDAINSSIEIVQTYELCVFNRPANQWNTKDWKGTLGQTRTKDICSIARDKQVHPDRERITQKEDMLITFVMHVKWWDIYHQSVGIRDSALLPVQSKAHNNTLQIHTKFLLMYAINVIPLTALVTLIIMTYQFHLQFHTLVLHIQIFRKNSLLNEFLRHLKLNKRQRYQL